MHVRGQCKPLDRCVSYLQQFEKVFHRQTGLVNDRHEGSPLQIVPMIRDSSAELRRLTS